MSEAAEGALPIHGFVLAGGQSSRMGRDKALLPFGGEPMVEIALRKLRGICAEVAVVGNREDLARFAPVVSGERAGRGPAAGIEAGMRACRQPWAMFLPVDVPLVPASLLRLWAQGAFRAGVGVSFLVAGRNQPAFCLLQQKCAASLSALLGRGVDKLERLLQFTAEADGCAFMTYSAADLFVSTQNPGPDGKTLERWFYNVNTAADLAGAEAATEACAELAKETADPA